MSDQAVRCNSLVNAEPARAFGSPDRSIVAQFETWARQTPAAIALSWRETEWSYQTLNEQANRLAYHLKTLGIGRGQIVGVCQERSFGLFRSLLAISKTGAGYLPIDPDTPPSRLAFFLNDAQAPLLLTDHSTHPQIDPIAITSRLLNLDEIGERLDLQPPANLDLAISGEDLAYLMYTSGSTGSPKGVLIPHRGVVRLVRGASYCEFLSEHVFLQLAPISFDASTFEIWGPLLNGGRLAIMPPGVPDLEAIGNAIRTERVTTLWLTSGLFQLMVDHRPNDLKNLRQLLAGGDVLSPGHVRKAFDVIQDGVIINGYGPTECTTFAVCHRMSRQDLIGSTLPIGRPIEGTTVQVVDEQLQPISPGNIGELLIGGDGVGLGYQNDPELTRNKFLKDPLGNQTSSTLYRSGDLVRQRSDGLYEFIGRIDDQIKVLGHRVEPREIEACLQRHPDVAQALVLARPDANGTKQIIAYVKATATLDTLRAYLKTELPSYLHPKSLIAVDDFPLTSRGKIDRTRLPLPESGWGKPKPSPDRFQPQDLGSKLQAIWEQALQTPVELDANLFDVGGTSLLMIEIHAQMASQLNIKIPLIKLFEHATITSLVEYVTTDIPRSDFLSQTQTRASHRRQATARRQALRTSNGRE